MIIVNTATDMREAIETDRSWPCFVCGSMIYARAESQVVRRAGGVRRYAHVACVPQLDASPIATDDATGTEDEIRKRNDTRTNEGARRRGGGHGYSGGDGFTPA